MNAFFRCACALVSVGRDRNRSTFDFDVDVDVDVEAFSEELGLLLEALADAVFVGEVEGREVLAGGEEVGGVVAVVLLLLGDDVGLLWVPGLPDDRPVAPPLLLGLAWDDLVPSDRVFCGTNERSMNARAYNGVQCRTSEREGGTASRVRVSEGPHWMPGSLWIYHWRGVYLVRE